MFGQPQEVSGHLPRYATAPDLEDAKVFRLKVRQVFGPSVDELNTRVTVDTDLLTKIISDAAEIFHRIGRRGLEQNNTEQSKYGERQEKAYAAAQSYLAGNQANYLDFARVIQAMGDAILPDLVKELQTTGPKVIKEAIRGREKSIMRQMSINLMLKEITSRRSPAIW